MPLYYLGLHFWMALGRSEFMLRLPSVFFSVSTIPVLYALGKRLFDTRVGVTAALLFAIHGASIEYAQEARTYSLVVLLATLSYLYFRRFLDRPCLATWTGWMLTTALTIYAHPLAAVIVPAQWACLLFIRPKGECRWWLVGAGLAIVLISMPLAFLFASGPQTPWNWISTTSPYGVLALFVFLSGWTNYIPGILGASLLILYLIFGTSALMDFSQAAEASRERRDSYGLLLLGVCIPVGLILITSLHRPLLVHRYFLVSLPALVLLAAAGICSLRPVRLFRSALTLLVTIALCGDLYYYTYFFKPDYRGAVTYVVSNAQPHDWVVFTYPPPVAYYWQRLRNSKPSPQTSNSSAWVISYPGLTTEAERAHVAKMHQDLVRAFPAMSEIKFHGVTVYRFERFSTASPVR